MCRARRCNLIGPPPHQLIGVVPDEWVLQVGDAQLADWQRIGNDPAHAELTVLTACRIWRYGLEKWRSCDESNPAGAVEDRVRRADSYSVRTCASARMSSTKGRTERAGCVPGRMTPRTSTPSISTRIWSAAPAGSG